VAPGRPVAGAAPLVRRLSCAKRNTPGGPGRPAFDELTSLTTG